MKIFSNVDVARQAGVHPGTLERWLAAGELRWPKVLITGRRVVRLWKQEDVERVRRCKARNCAKALRRSGHRPSRLEAEHDQTDVANRAPAT